MADISTSGGDIGGVLYLCGWLWGDSPGDPIAASFANGKTDCNSYKKSTVMSLTGWGTQIIHCFTHLYFFWRSA
ncbi:MULTISPECIES: hypothetical protein [unclassified Microcoleus]|uniref:hypothetical protein n=1 Tax=unclassified Microcoleus TaxID=2642155 RepID=UPI002FCFB0D3